MFMIKNALLIALVGLCILVTTKGNGRPRFARAAAR